MTGGRRLSSEQFDGLRARAVAVAVAVACLCAGTSAAAGLRCDRTAEAGQDEAGQDEAGRLCQAFAAALMDAALVAEGVRLDVVQVRADLVAARVHRNGEVGPLVQIVAMDGPLLPDWPERMAADLVRAMPPP